MRLLLKREVDPRSRLAHRKTRIHVPYLSMSEKEFTWRTQ
jgi:hypothetical protein